LRIFGRKNFQKDAAGISKSAPVSANAETSAIESLGLFRRTVDSLSDRDFRYFFFGLLLLMGGVNIQMLARSMLAYEMTDSALLVGVVGAGFAPPILLFSLFGGAVADRVDRKRIIQFGQAGVFVIAGLVAVAIFAETVTIYHLIVASVAQGTLWAFLMPARQAIIPQLVGDDRMTNAIALTSSGMSLMTLTAPVVGGIIYGSVGAGPVYTLIAFMAAGSFLLTTALPHVGKLNARGANAMLSDMKEGLDYVAGRPIVLALLLLALSTALLAMPFRSLMVVLLDEIFSKGVEELGVMMGMIGLGSLLGSLFFAGMTKSQPRGVALIIATIVSGLGMLGATVAPSYWMLFAIMVFVGLGDAGRRTLNNSLIMEQVDDEHRGRVMGLYMMNFGLMPVGALPIAAAAEHWGIANAIAISAITLTVIGLGFLFFAKKVRRL
jgi:MFS family permease